MDGQGEQVGHQSPFGDELFECDIDALAARVGRAAVQQVGLCRKSRRTVDLALHGKGPLFVLANSLEVLREPRLGRGAKRRVGTGESLVLVDDGVQHATFEPLLLGVARAAGDGNRAEDAIE